VLVLSDITVHWHKENERLLRTVQSPIGTDVPSAYGIADGLPTDSLLLLSSTRCAAASRKLVAVELAGHRLLIPLGPLLMLVSRAQWP